MKNTRYYLPILLLLTFGCSKYIDFEGDSTISKITLNGLMKEGDPVKIHLSKSLNVLDTAELSEITNATVQLYNANTAEFIENLSPVLIDDKTFYSGAIATQANVSYEVRASAGDYKSVKGVSDIPNQSLLVSSDIDTVSIPSLEQYGIDELQVTFNMTDLGEGSNYYGIKVSGQIVGSTFYGIDNLYISTEESIVEVNSNKGVLFSNEFFEGTSRDFSFKINPFYYNPLSSDLSPILYDSIIVTISTYSEDLFFYHKSAAQFSQADGFFSQPVQVYSNIENGLGVLGGLVEEKIVFSISE